MPLVTGFLRVVRRPGHPDQGLPDPEHPVDPDYGVDEGLGIGGGPIIPEPPIPDPPPGIWPPLTPDQPWRPVDPGYGLPGGLPDRPSTGPVRPGRPPGQPDQGLPGEEPHPEHPIVLPPGTIWPPLPPGVHGKYLALVLIAGMPGGPKYRYVVVDADARPEHPIAPGGDRQPK